MTDDERPARRAARRPGRGAAARAGAGRARARPDGRSPAASRTATSCHASPARTSATSSARPATTRTCSASAARSSTRRRSPRPGVGVGPGGDRVHPARGLPRHPVHRGLAGQRRGGPSAGDPRARGVVAAAHPRRPADPGPVRAAPDRRGLPGVGRGPRRPDPAGVRAGRGRRSPDRAGLPRRPARARGPATTTCSTRTSSTTARASGSSTGSTPAWAIPFFDLGNFSINHELTRRPGRLSPRGLRRRDRRARSASRGSR